MLKFLVTALHEMSTAWKWSRRAIKALSQLAKEWSIGEEIAAAIASCDCNPVQSLDLSHPSTIGLGLPSDSGLSDWIFEDVNEIDAGHLAAIWQDTPDLTTWPGELTSR